MAEAGAGRRRWRQRGGEHAAAVAVLWRAYRDVLGPDAVPADSPLERRTLVWRLMRLLPALSAGPEFAVLRGFLAGDDDGRKLFQLAGKLAELFDQYQVYRADWLADWQAGRDGLAQTDGQWRALTDDDRWQPALWRALLADIAADGHQDIGRAQIHQQFCRRWPPPRAARRPCRAGWWCLAFLPCRSRRWPRWRRWAAIAR